MEILNTIKFNAKNLLGWQTKRRIVAFSVDDYGNVRLDSKKAGEKMRESGLEAKSRFDLLDSLENTRDLEMLLETLYSVRDYNGNHPVFTVLAVPCNIDFERMAEDNNNHYYYELLPETFAKLEARFPKAYNGTWKLWQEGISKQLIVPQFHGREHFNLKVFNEKIRAKDRSILISLQNRSNARIKVTGYSSIIYTAAFQFWDFKENDHLQEIIRDGLDCFEKVFNQRASEFNAPGSYENSVLHKVLSENGIRYLYTGRLRKEHQGFGKYKTRKELYYTGRKNHLGQVYIVKNSVFEPSDNRGYDWINYTLKEIEAAFRWKKPAIISSHRANYSGHIDEKNREIGITSLRNLLLRIVERWPDVEFMSTENLLNILRTENDGKENFRKL